MNSSTIQFKTDIENIDLAEVPFADEVLVHFQPESSKYQFGKPYVGKADLTKLRGVGHAGYAGRTWGDLIPTGLSIDGPEDEWHDVPSPLKRARSALIYLKQNPDYYLSAEMKKPSWSFFELHGDYYLDMDAAHRSVIARAFLWLNDMPQVVSGVTVTRLDVHRNASD